MKKREREEHVARLMAISPEEATDIGSLRAACEAAVARFDLIMAEVLKYHPTDLERKVGGPAIEYQARAILKRLRRARNDYLRSVQCFREHHEVFEPGIQVRIP